MKNPGERILWSDIYELGARLDAIASVSTVPGYVPLKDLEDMPFKFESVLAIGEDLRIHYELEEGNGKITNVWIGRDRDFIWNPPDPVYAKMAEIGDLFMVLEEDGCICENVQKVELTPGNNYKFTEVEEKNRCCWSLKFPDIGASLNKDQFIIPSTWITYFSVPRFLPEIPDDDPSPFVWISRPACDGGASILDFKFRRRALRQYILVAVERTFRVRCLTWPVRKKYYEALMDRIIKLSQDGTTGVRKYKMRISPTSGASPLCTPALPTMDPVIVTGFGGDRRGHLFYKATTPGQPIQPGCTPTERDIQNALFCDKLLADPSFVETPGCMTELGARPWLTSTCGGVPCPDHPTLPKVYANTFNALTTLVDQLESGWFAPGADGITANGCCFDGIPTGAFLPPIGTGSGLINLFGEYTDSGPFVRGVWSLKPTRIPPMPACGVVHQTASGLCLFVNVALSATLAFDEFVDPEITNCGFTATATIYGQEFIVVLDPKDANRGAALQKIVDFPENFLNDEIIVSVSHNSHAPLFCGSRFLPDPQECHSSWSLSILIMVLTREQAENILAGWEAS